ncbi:hypothetical protein FHS18_000227 [Paenibacillus phyllosphaerae]|uniref:Pyridoxamine 5'-phosphate oxidase N-terminal domain-containing protein n=1 Tax=Paenibacillus phyllosphaerae TaxID=274593 RepID=A0A7W5ASZ7_9BACL|nr:MSMEG_1061 family FMN-dependent PPOX-type flavoprotein [Paenibacillus phyllosphaerae]MBB3108199.1 hypothetical protein [Paenibacillus phyllosphaerae]
MSDTLWATDRITSAEEIRAMIDQPHEAVVMKTVHQIDSHIADFIAKSPLFFLGTSADSGRADVSPRGDAPGFVKVLNERTLAFADRPGNRRLDSLLNIIEHPQVGMMFTIPGLNEVLRINGRAGLSKNEALLEQLGLSGKTTGIVVIVEVEECFIHCPRAFKQAGIWDSQTWPQEHPSTMDMFKAHLKLNGYQAKE